MAGSIKRGKWCPVCRENELSELLDIQKLAAEKGGICLSEKYINSYTKLKWQCKEGHIWETSPQQIRSGHWCPDCSIRGRRYTIEQMQKMAGAKGGVCLSTEYINKKTELKWQCKEGHIWETRPEQILRGSWCPECNKLQRNKIEKIN